MPRSHFPKHVTTDAAAVSATAGCSQRVGGVRRSGARHSDLYAYARRRSASGVETYVCRTARRSHLVSRGPHGRRRESRDDRRCSLAQIAFSKTRDQCGLLRGRVFAVCRQTCGLAREIAIRAPAELRLCATVTAAHRSRSIVRFAGGRRHLGTSRSPFHQLPRDRRDGRVCIFCTYRHRNSNSVVRALQMPESM